MGSDLAELKMELRKAGFARKAILSDSEFAGALERIEGDPRVLTTPAEELRYIEGLLTLPYGHLDLFNVIPKSGPTCECGRTMSALDIVAHAVTRRTHDRELLRDTLLGLSNVFEIAEDGRTADCFKCGRSVTAAHYYTRRYMYA
jgi:hypothetical protein